MFPGYGILLENTPLNGSFHAVDNPSIWQAFHAFGHVSGTNIVKGPFVVSLGQSFSCSLAWDQEVPGMPKELLLVLDKATSGGRGMQPAVPRLA